MTNKYISSVDPRNLSRRTFLRAAGLTCAYVGVGSILAGCSSNEPVVGASSTNSSNPTADNATNVSNSTTSSASSATTSHSSSTSSGSSSAATNTPLAGGINDPRQIVTLFLAAWHDKRYADMYALLSATAKSGISQDAFVTRYQNITAEATIIDVAGEVSSSAPTPSATPPDKVQIPYSVKVTTARVGQIAEDNYLILSHQSNGWGIDWSPSAIFKNLGTDNLVHMYEDSSLRGQVYDRNGKPMAINDQAYTVFVVPGKITDENAVLTILSQTLQMDKDKIKSLYSSGQPTWQMPIKDLPSNTPQNVLDSLIAVKGIGYDTKYVRSYPQKDVAGNTIGYVGPITTDDLKTFATKGYTVNDQIGRVGLERAEELDLAGTKGGKLAIVSPDGALVQTLQQSPSQPGSDLTLTIETNLQKTCEQLLGKTPGSIVVMDPNDGSILALATNPRYDPNVFVNGISQADYDKLNNDPQKPLVNRAIEGAYPTGSIFKVITASCALEKAGVTMQTTFTCQGKWTGLGPNQPAMYCWNKYGHGRISLYQGIVQSCDVVFYELGKKLYEVDPNLLPTFAEQAYGLGSGTGVQGLQDNAGQVPDNTTKKNLYGQVLFPGDIVNLAIGQGYLLATPLQMANVYSLIAAGGAQPVPNIILHKDTNGIQTQAVPQKRANTQKVAPALLAQIKQALHDVTSTAAGTATAEFYGVKVPVAGKTGTAESGVTDPHGWFACFAPVDKPKYVVIVMQENAGEGNVVSAPLARKVIDVLNF